ncbi:MAG: hypothetical protein ABEJ25_03490 [Candidatus Bipolaricaulia bacterium]
MEDYVDPETYLQAKTGRSLGDLMTTAMGLLAYMYRREENGAFFVVCDRDDKEELKTVSIKEILDNDNTGKGTKKEE